MKKIVYHKQFKFGVVEVEDEVFYTCRFHNEFSTRRIIKEKLEEIPQDIVFYINDKQYDSLYSLAIRQRGKECFVDGKVKNVIYEENEFQAQVIGNDVYNVSFNFLTDKIGINCSCPCHFNCKHSYALFAFLNKVFSDLLNVEVKYEVSKELKSITTSFFEYSESVQTITKIAKELIDLGDFEIKNYFKYLKNSNYKDNKIKSLILFLCYRKDLADRIIPILDEDNNYPFYNELKKGINASREIESQPSSYDDQVLITYHGINEDYRRLFYVLLDRLDNYRYYDLFRFVIDNLKIDDEILERFIDRIEDFDDLSSSSFYFINHLSLEHKLKLYSDKRCVFRLWYEDYSREPLEVQKAIILNGQFYSHDGDIILTRIVAKSRDLDFNLKVLFRLREKRTYIDPRTLNKFLSKYDDNYYLKLALNSSYLIDVSRYIDYRPKAKLANEQAFFKYFKIDYEIIKRYEYNHEFDTQTAVYYPEYQVKDVNGANMLTVRKENDYLYIVEKSYFESRYEEIAEYVVKYIEGSRADEVSEKLKEKNAEQEKFLMQLRLDRIVDQMDNVDREFNGNALVLADNRKASLDYCFSIDAENGDYELSIKVGIDRKYVVKNILEFLSFFKREQTHKYGKELTLTHRLQNFNDNDAKIIDRLLTISSFTSYHQNSIKLNDNLFDAIFNDLKGRKVLINGEEVRLTLENVNLSFKIDENYIFSINEDISGYKSLKTNNKYYLLDSNKKEVNVIDCSKTEKAFYEFAFNYNGMCVEQVKNDFRDKIYSNFQNQIRIDEKLKEDFKLKNIQINAYFDYRDHSIFLNSEYLIEDKKIDLDKIKNLKDIYNLNNYQSYIKSIGFENDVLSDDSKIINFFNMDFSALKKYCSVYLSESIQNKKVSMFSPGKIIVTYKNNMMQAFLGESEFSDDELEEIVKSLRRKKKYILLSDDRIVDLSSEDANEFYDTVKDLGLNQKSLLEPTALPIINSLKALSHEKMCSVDEYLSNMITDISSYKNADYPIPQIEATLRDYQKEAFYWLKTLCKYEMGGVLADDMGLGKTLEIITTIVSDEDNKPSLIVCPKALVFNWKNEFNRFAPNEKVIELYGPKDVRESLIKDIKDDEKVIYITSYDSMNRDEDLYTQSFNFLIIDEAQAIKNVNALKTKTVKNVTAKHKFALTGTPIENNMIDLYSIFDFILPGFFTDLNEFKNNHDNEEFIKKLSKRIAPFILRRTKEDVLKDLPDKYERVLTCEMNKTQRKIYDGERMAAKKALDAGGGSFDVLPYLMKLRQICVDPSTIVENYKGGSAKMETLIETVDAYLQDGHRLLIFSQFVTALDLIGERLKQKDIPYFTITGKTSAKRRLEIVNEFNAGSKENIVLISLKAGGTGLNLIGADTVIHLDPWWNVAAENQASDRSHRIGQTKNVEVIKLICEDSIEQRVIELQNIKKDLIDKLISNNDKSVTSATLEDIKFILD